MGLPVATPRRRDHQLRQRHTRDQLTPRRLGRQGSRRCSARMCLKRPRACACNHALIARQAISHGRGLDRKAGNNQRTARSRVECRAEETTRRENRKTGRRRPAAAVGRPPPAAAREGLLRWPWRRLRSHPKRPGRLRLLIDKILSLFFFHERDMNRQS